MHTAGRPFNEGRSCRAHGAWASLRNGKNVETSGGTNKFEFCLALPKDEARLVPCHLSVVPELSESDRRGPPGLEEGRLGFLLPKGLPTAGKLFCQGVFKAET